MKHFIRVLIVDDENIFRNALRNMIRWEEEGFLVVGFAENGRQALSLLDATAPQIVITDVAMPVMNGVELLKAIKQRNESRGGAPIETIVISGFDTFSYVRDAMKSGAFDYILKSELNAETLLTRLNTLAACLPQPDTAAGLEPARFFQNLLDSSYSSLAFVQEALDGYGLGIDLAKPLFLIRSFCSDKSEEYLQGPDARRVLAPCLQGLPATAFLYQGSCMLLGNQEALEPALSAVGRQAEDYPALYWGVQRPYPVLEEPRRMQADFAQIPRQFFYAPSRKIFFVQPDLHFQTSSGIDTALVVQTVSRGDAQAIVRYLGDFLAGCVQDNVTPYAVKKSCEQAIHTILYAMEKNSQDMAALNPRKIEFFRRIDLAATIDELCDALESVLEEIFAADWGEEEYSSALIAAISRFVEENYSHPLRLSDVVEHVHISYHHLSRILNAHYREPFNDYLNRVRIQAAQQLICTSDWPIGRIAEEVGFANQSYFGKVFKKQVGISPRLYRLQKAGKG